MSRAPNKSRGFTLVELVISLGISALLVAGLGGVILLSVKAIPNSGSAASRVGTSSRGADLLTTELYYAQSFSNLGANSVTFTVAPRGSDSSPETITYSWSGVQGDPLLRQYNSNPPAPVVFNVAGFSLTYNKAQRQNVKTVKTSSTMPEQLLASCTGWPGVTPTFKDFAASSTNQISEFFTVPNSSSSWPTGATLNVTRVRLPLKAFAGGGASYTVGLYRPASTSGPVPSTVGVGSPVTISASTLTTSYVWTDIYLPGASVSNSTQNGFCVVIGAPSSTSSVNAQYIYSTSAPADTPTMQSSSDGGSTWGPSTNTNQQDLEFSFYGQFTTTTTSQQTVTDSYLQSVGLQLQTGTDGKAPLNTTVEVYTQPIVTGL
jgi:prepilin-type N-terminal cleavage/methylation domain-containing protein